MKQKPAAFLLALSILAYAFLLAFAGYRIFASRSAAVRASERDFASLVRLAQSALAQGRDFRSKAFLEQMRTRYALSPRLIALTVRDSSGSLGYAIPAESALTAPPAPGGRVPAFLRSFLERVRTFPTHRLTRSMDGPGGPYSVEAVYTALPTASALAALRDSLIGVVALVFIAGVILLIAAFSEEDSSDLGAAMPLANTVPAFSESPPASDLSDEFQVPAFDIDEAAPPSYPQRLESQAGNPQGLFSPRSGLGWESYLTERLDAELSRSASLGMDCAFLLLDCGPAEPEDRAYREIASSIRDFFGFKDIAFERGRTGFAIILPGKSIDEALKAARDFIPLLPSGSRIGLSGRSDRHVDSALLMQEAQSALEKAGVSGDSPVIGFKADPDRYRNFVSGKL